MPTKLYAGSIPAHAGEPARPHFLRVVKRVYPRPRGGTVHIQRRRDCDNGLSPPTRGNPAAERAFLRSIGSIPAHAGEPFAPLARLG